MMSDSEQEARRRSIIRLRQKGWSLDDIADRHNLTTEEVRVALGMEVKRGILR